MPITETARFERCLDAVLSHEGGYVDNPRDPGGATNLGVTLAVAKANGLDLDHDGDVDKIDVRNLKPRDVRPVYRKSYWLAAGCDLLPAGLDYLVFDTAVNSGVSRAVRFLQECVGVRADGKIGPMTLGAARRLPASEVVLRYRNRREGFYRSLSTFDTFGRGWLRRLAEVAVKADQWARET